MCEASAEDEEDREGKENVCEASAEDEEDEEDGPEKGHCASSPTRANAAACPKPASADAAAPRTRRPAAAAGARGAASELKIPASSCARRRTRSVATVLTFRTPPECGNRSPAVVSLASFAHAGRAA